MKRPTVRQTHAICDSLNARAVIVIALDKDNFAIASYGETKLECQQTAFTVDTIAEMLAEGKIPMWATAESEKERIEHIYRERTRRAIAEGEYCPSCKTPWSECDCSLSFEHTRYDEEDL